MEELHEFNRRNFATVYVDKLPAQLKTVQHENKTRCGCGILMHFGFVFLFVFFTFYLLTLETKTVYLSVKYASEDTWWNKVECYEVTITNTALRELDENGTFDSYYDWDPLNSIKEIQYRTFSGNSTVYAKDLAELNDCIEDLNDYMEEHSMINNLLYISEHTCTTSAGTEMSFPMHWGYVFDPTYSDVTFEDPNGDYVWDMPADASILGKYSLILDVDCTNHTYTNASSPFCPDEKDNTLTLNFDSLMRCIAVNQGVVEPDYTDDMLVLAGEWPFIFGLVEDTVNPTQMYIWNDTCYLYYEARGSSTSFLPYVDYWDNYCNLDCDDSSRASCYNDFDLNIKLESYLDDGSYGTSVTINTYGSYGMVNDNMFKLNTTGDSCRGWISEIPIVGTDEDDDNIADTPSYATNLKFTAGKPFDLIQSFYSCNSTTRSTPQAAVGVAYSNAGLFMSVFLTVIPLLAVRLCPSKEYLTEKAFDEKYPPDEMERALKTLCAKFLEDEKLGIEGGGGGAGAGGAPPPATAFGAAPAVVPESVPEDKAEGGQKDEGKVEEGKNNEGEAEEGEDGKAEEATSGFTGMFSFLSRKDG